MTRESRPTGPRLSRPPIRSSMPALSQPAPMQIADAPLGTAWFLEYVGWCLMHNLSVAGGLELASRLGLPHADFQASRDRTVSAEIPPLRRSIVSG